MRHILIILFVLGLVSCAEKPMDVEQAKKVVELLIRETDAGNYNALENLYSPAFNQSEPIDVKQKKLERLKDILGKVEQVEFINFTHVAEFGQPKQIVLEYKIKHTKVTSIEKFTVIEEEGGYRVSSHSVETEMQ
jgi:hypothetical protein